MPQTAGKLCASHLKSEESLVSIPTTNPLRDKLRSGDTAMGWGLAAGWVAYLAVLTPLMRPMWRQEVNT